MSESVWPADMKRRIPTGSLHLSKGDRFDATIKTESSFNTLSAIVSRRSISVFDEPVDFFSLRKTIGDRTWLEISSPGVPDSSADKKHRRHQGDQQAPVTTYYA
jgi:hypothetical protein